MTGAEDELVKTREGSVVVLRLNRPDARNALTPALLRAVGGAFLAAERDPEIAAVVLTGAGDRAFCAGMDLRSFSSGGAFGAGEDEATTTYYRFLDGRVAVPVVGAANGTALAGGLELLLGCDVIVASADARFGLPEVKRGLFAAGGGTALGTRLPLGIALEMTLTGDPISAQRAYEVGLVNAVVAPDEVLDAAVGIASRIAANAPLALAATKELVRLAVVDAVGASARAKEWQSVVFSSDDAKEGAMAFVEKREPVWQGR